MEKYKENIFTDDMTTDRQNNGRIFYKGKAELETIKI